MGKAIILENLDFSRGNLGVVTIRRNTPILGLTISADDTFVGEFLQLRVTYNPVNTTQVGVIWSIESGTDYATIDSYGKLTVLSSAEEAEDVVVKAVSTFNPSIYNTKTISVTYDHQSDELNGITINGNSSVTGTQANYSVSYNPSNTWKTGVTWQVVSGSEYCSITNSGVLAIKEGASSSPATIRAISIYDPSIYGEKQITVTYLDAIYFADPETKAVCVANWDTNGDGEISQLEAKAVTSIKSQFHQNTEITSFDEFRFFTNVNSIERGGRGFQGCTSLQSIILPPNLTDLSGTYGYFFSGCSSLTSVDVSHVTTLGSYCFSSCTSLERMVGLNDNITKIPNGCFFGCSSLTEITIPSHVTSIGKSAFYNDSNLVTVRLSASGLTSIGDEAFRGCSKLELSSLPSTLQGALPTNCFKSCAKITISVVPEGVTSLGGDCFMGCSAMRELTLPSTLASMGSRALYNTSFTKVICLATTPPTITSNTRSGSWPVYVPDESVQAYKEAENWSAFPNKIFPISDLEPAPEPEPESEPE